MKKLVLFAALPFALGLAACGDSTPDAADGTATDAAAMTATDDARSARPTPPRPRTRPTR